MKLGGFGGSFDLPDWVENLIPKKAPEAAPPPPPPPSIAQRIEKAADQLLALPKVEELRAKIGAGLQRAFGPGSEKDIGWIEKAGKPPRDVSGSFNSTYAAVKAGQHPLPKEAKDHVYLNVGGLFTKHYPGYMDENTKRMKELGLDTRSVPIDSDASVESNAKVIRDAILKASKDGKKVVLTGHSKGGVDITAALALYPELRPHVRAVVAMQSPYGGSPIANDVSNCPTCPELTQAADAFVKNVFRGSPDALKDLSYDRRKAFVTKHPYPSNEIPTVALATSSDTPVSMTAKASGYIRARYGERSDGLVIQRDAVIPGSNVVKLDGLDHACAAMKGVDGVATSYAPGDLTETLLAVALTTPPVR